jgi:glycosyltransferase involved in cell wall biosynthesis
MGTDAGAIQVLSFNHTVLCGVSTWNLRMTEAFARWPELGIAWTLIEDLGPFNNITGLHSLPDALQKEVVFLDPKHMTTRAAVRRGMRNFPRLANKPDVILVNNSLAGWMYGEEMSRRFGNRRPRIAGALHNDEAIYYDLCGGQGPCDLVFGVSQHICAEFARRNPNGPPVRFMPYPVPTADRFTPRPATGPLRMAYAGRLAQEQKRVFDLPPLMRMLIDSNVDFELHLAGGGPAGAELRASLAKVAGARFKDHGTIPVGEIPKLMAESDVILSVSEFEGTSLSMLEAMGQGVTPVVTDVASGVRDVISPGESGYLSTIGDMAAMAKHLQMLANDRAILNRTGAAAWKIVDERYSMRAAAAALAGLIRETAGARAKPFRLNKQHPYFSRMERMGVPDILVRGLRGVQGMVKPKRYET